MRIETKVGELTQPSHVATVMTVVKQLAVSSVMLLVNIVVFYVAAGSIDERAGIFFIASALHYSVSILMQYRLNPELLAARLVFRREGSKRWDEIVMRGSNLMVLLAMPAVAGFDVGRWQETLLDTLFIIPGILLFLLSSVLLNWAMAVNPYFEPTVRIQRDRDHRAVTHGPYRVVRHPGYLAGIAYVLSAPLIIGSGLAMIPAGIYLLLIVLRTALEDNTLRQELAGYIEYAKTVKYRLLPGIW
jgi:protein-S-isoprenylcysteine O-methyltransferase Ste14